MGRSTGTSASCGLPEFKVWKPREIARLHVRKVQSAMDAARVVREVCGTDFLVKEHAVTIVIDAKSIIIGITDATSDHVAMCMFHPTDLVSAALQIDKPRRLGATILGHNHPSGNVQASTDDIKMTDAMLCYAPILGIVDHVVVGPDKSPGAGPTSINYFSMFEQYGDAMFKPSRCKKAG